MLKGSHHTPESRAKTSASLKGRGPLSDETRRKLHDTVAMKGLRKSDEEYFVREWRHPGVLVRRYRKLGKPYICGGCGQGPMWNEEPLVLHLDHKDGDRSNNTLENLRWLCPNCYSQTPTYAGKKRGRV